MKQRNSRVSLKLALFAILTACGGGLGTPQGSVVGYGGGGPTPPPTKIVDVALTVSLNLPKGGARPNYLSSATQSLVVQLVAVNGNAVTGIGESTVNTTPKAHGCTAGGERLICKATVSGSPGRDQFAVTTYSGTNAGGEILSIGSVDANVSGGGSGFQISNKLSLDLDGVVASLKLAVLPNSGKRGQKVTAKVALDAYDAAGAQIVGPSAFYNSVTLSIQGDVNGAFVLHGEGQSGQSLSLTKPPSGLTVDYDGNTQASSITLDSEVVGSNDISASAAFALKGKQPPPPVGTIYALNFGTKDGQGATVTEYGGTANGNAAPERTLSLSSKLYARSIAVDSAGNLYVGYFDNQYGFSPESGTPDTGNEIAIYAPGASGNAQPTALLQADKQTSTALFPLFIVFDGTGRLVTYGATTVDGNTGDAVLTYAAGSTGPVAPQHGWQFDSPQIRYAGPTGLALDTAGNFYVNGGLYTPLGDDYGVYVNAAANIGEPDSNPSRWIPWDASTELAVGQTTGVAIDSSSEVLVGNAVTQGSSSKRTCQARVNVFAAGATGGETDKPPLRVLTLEGVETDNPECVSTRDSAVPFFPSIVSYATDVFVADDFNNAINEFPGSANGQVKPTLRIAGNATQLNVPIALVVTAQASGRAKARPAYPSHASSRQ